MTIEERRERRSARPHSFEDASPLDALPQHALLYAALITSLAAVVFSVCAHRSTSFVVLGEPLELSPYLRNVDRVGLSAWDVCALRKEALDGMVADGSAVDGDDGADGEDGTGLAARLPLWAAKTATDVQRDVSSTVRTTYHPAPDAQSKGWMQEPDHDDVLVSADYPYNDDDEYEMNLPDEYWDCHRLQITSASARHDGKWNLARAFFMVGSICGVAATFLLGTLIVRRDRDARRRRRSRKDGQRKLQRRQSSRVELLGQTDTATQLAAATNELLLLDINSSGYRPISIYFVAAYLLQSLTLLFLDSQLCRKQGCSLSSGAHYLLIACVLWMASGVLVLTMFKQVRRNERRARLFKRRMDRRRVREDAAVRALQRTNSDGEEDAESLLSINASMDDDCSSDDAGTQYCKQIDEESELNTTADTECSECSASTTQEEAEGG